jgi:uncharacterized membrane protein
MRSCGKPSCEPFVLTAGWWQRQKDWRFAEVLRCDEQVTTQTWLSLCMIVHCADDKSSLGLGQNQVWVVLEWLALLTAEVRMNFQWLLQYETVIGVPWLTSELCFSQNYFHCTWVLVSSEHINPDTETHWGDVISISNLLNLLITPNLTCWSCPTDSKFNLLLGLRTQVYGTTISPDLWW